MHSLLSPQEAYLYQVCLTGQDLKRAERGGDLIFNLKQKVAGYQFSSFF